MIGMNVLFYLLFSVFALGQIARVSFAGQEINIYLYELILVISILLLASRTKIRFISERVTKWMGIWGVYLLIVLLITAVRYSPWQNFVALLYFARLALYCVYFVYLLAFVKIHLPFQHILHRSLLIATIITIVLSVAQYFLYPDIGNLYYLGWDPHLYRMAGAFLEPSVAGAIYGLFLIYILSRGKKQRYSVILVSFLTVCIFLTYSRGVFLGVLGTAVCYVFIKSLNKWLLMGFIAICLIGLFLLPKRFGEGMNLMRTSTIESRIENYGEALTVASRSPLFGIGYNHIRHERVAQRQVTINEPLSHSGASFHSSFLVILVTGGVLGLLIFFKVLMEIGRLHEAALFSTLFLSIISLTDNILLHPFVLLLWLSIAAIPFRTAR